VFFVALVMCFFAVACGDGAAPVDAAYNALPPGKVCNADAGERCTN
jgi:hypothetical protein